jgi:type VI secretion system protein ImpL
MSKEDLNENDSPRVLPFLALALAALFAGLWLWLLNEGPQRGWFADNRIAVGIALAAAWFACMFMAVLYERGIRQWAANSRIARAFELRRQKKQQIHAPTDEQRSPAFSISHLRNILRDRYGWSWRCRDQWVVVAGDEPLVKRLAPGLVNTGYAITGDTVLLYARETRENLDTAWLDQIRRLRRRRPVDAIVVVTRSRNSANAPFDAESLSQRLARHARALRWAAPAYLLNATDFDVEAAGPDESIGLIWSNARIRFDEVQASLLGLAGNLADAGVVRLTQDPNDRYPAELSRHIDGLLGALSDLVMQTRQSRFWRNAVHGMLFAPLFKEHDLVSQVLDPESEDGEPISAPQQRAIWQTVADHSRKIHGRRVGFSLSTTAAWVTTALVGLWIAGSMLSGMTNRATIRLAEDTSATLSTTQNPTQAALNLNDLQKQLDTLEVHQRDGAPWYTRFGLNRDAELFAALWPSYESGASRIVVAPIRAKLEERLRQLASLSDTEIASGGDAQIKSAYATLKAYLMLAKPEHADATFLTPQLIGSGAPERQVNSTLSTGAWEDLRQHLIAFYANHLGHHVTADGSSLAIVPDAELVSATRQTVIGVRGIQNSTDAIYQQILDEAKPKYPPVSLATLLGETSSRGLFSTTATIPAIFTRAAWDERISKAINDANEQRSVTGDWVLSDVRTTAGPTASLKTELRQRYFDDYAREWEQFLNSLRWQPTSTLSGTVDQLTLLADPQRSPLAALMNVVVYQAGTGAVTQSLSDSLLNKAQQLVGADEKDPSKIAQSQNAAPLAAAFGPLLRLAGSDLVGSGSNAANGKGVAQMAATGDLSVPRYMERVTAMRLKLQQIMMGGDPDAMSRAAAQSVLQGKTSDIADSRDYASRVAASLGEQWAGFGDLFEAPLDQTWQVVLQPAASSLNDTWRTAIVADWNKTFGGRYPFADSDNDASLPEMARFMRPDNGVITQFVTSQLAGIVERQGDRWVPAQGANRSALTVDPKFLAALNKLMRVSTVLFPSGDAHIRYELRAVPTPGVTDMKFVLSGRELHYFNQKEEWTPFVWPGDTLENITHIEWQTEQGGLRSALDMQGRFGFIRLLERAKVTPQDNARYLLTWMPDAAKEAAHPAGSAPATPEDDSEASLEGTPLGSSRSGGSAHGKAGATPPGVSAPQPAPMPGLGIPLRVQLRSESGAGPLDVLALRNFTLPGRIFVTAPVKGAQKPALPGPPPLPLAAIAAAKRAAVPLPHGALPEVE